MKVYKYQSYKEYKKAQTEANKMKITKVWALADELISVVDYIKKNIPDASSGLCHGVRNGWEVNFFKDALGINVIGTEISDTAKQFPNVIRWDFHNVKPEWISNIDFIYSNALDHSYKPTKCLDSWMTCISDKGKCFIHHAKAHNGKSDIVDPFKASFEEYSNMIEKKYIIEDVINIENSPKRSRIFVIIKK